MPELPEVETTLRGVIPYLLNQRIESVWASHHRLRSPLPDLTPIEGHRIITMQRRSKYMIWEVSNGQSLIMHLGMSGRLAVQTPQDIVESHTHIILKTSNGVQIRYIDPRRFGMALLVPSSGLAHHPLLAKLGPEPLSPKLTAAALHARLSKTSRSIKTALLDQTLICGLGNIYVCEALFRSRIHPLCLASSMTLAQARTLLKHVRAVLLEAITAGGSSLKDFKHSDGNLGYFQKQFDVYGRAGAPCNVCQTALTQIKQGGRSTIFCTNCQVLP